MSDTTVNQDLDLSFLLEIADGSNEFIIESIDMFLQQTPDLLNSIEEGINAQDWPATASSAHKLKPNLGFFGMLNSQSAMQEIELLAKSGSPDPAEMTAKFSQVKQVINVNLTKLVQIKAEKESEL